MVGEGRFEEAISTLEGITDAAARAQAAYPLAGAYTLADRPRQALPLLESLQRGEPETGSSVHIAGLLIRVYRQLGRNEDADRVVESLSAEMPDDVDALCIVGEAKDAVGDEKGASGAYEKALLLAKGSHRDLVNLAAGDFHLRHHRFGEAAEAYKHLVDPNRRTPITKKYLFAAVRAGRLQEALELAQNVRKASGVIPEIAEVEAGILEYVNDLKHARELLLELSSLEPANAAYRVRTAFIDIRLGERQRAAAVVAELSEAEIAGLPELLLDAAKLRAFLGLPGALDLAYRGLVAGFQDADIHFGYISLFLSRDKKGDPQFEKEVADVGCTVHLQRGEEHVAYTIVETAPGLRRSGKVPRLCFPKVTQVVSR